MANSDVWQILESDDFLRQFLHKDASKDVAEPGLWHGLAVADQLKKLSEGIVLLDKELQRQVLDNHEDLLSQATWVDKLEGVLATMQTRVQCLLSAVERLRTKVVEPYHAVETQTLVLARLHATSDLLRRVARMQHLCKRLRAQAGAGDLVKAAQSLCELAHLAENVDLGGLEVLEEDQRTIRSHRADVERQARLMLHQGLQAHNDNQVSTAVHVFSSLGSLDVTVEQCVRAAQQRVARGIREAVDVQALTQVTSSDAGKPRGAPGRAAMPSPGTSSAFRSRLWTALDHLFDAVIYAECCQVQLLHGVLTRRGREPGVLVPTPHRCLAGDFWHHVTTLLSKQLTQTAHTTSFVKQTLEGEYPKLLRLYVDLCKRLQAAVRGVPQADSEQDAQEDAVIVFQVNRDMVVPFENAYLSRSVSRLLDPVNLMFSGEAAAPSHEEVDALIRTITSELSVSLVDASLSRTVARNISKAVRLFCLKCEQMVVSGGDATQVIDSCTPGQLLNLSVANQLHYLAGQVSRVVANMKSSLPADTAAIVLESLAHADTLTANIVAPILTSVADAIEAIILTMHNEDYSLGAADGASQAATTITPPDAPCSLYMKELQAFIARATTTYLAPFHNQEVVSKRCMDVAVRCVELFLRHVCLVRPLGEGGRMKLAADFAQMEMAVAPLCRQVSELGRSYKMLRSFRPLLFLTPEHVAASSTLGDVIPYSLALLSQFARGPLELPSPHQSANWSMSRFSQWLDTHPSERERLELMSGALQRYQQTVRQKGETSFHAVYPVMVDLLERGLESAGK